MAKQPKWNTDEENILRECIAKKIPFKDIAAFLNRSLSSIYTRRYRLEIENPCFLSRSEEEELRACIDSGMTIADAAEALGRPKRQIKSIKTIRRIPSLSRRKRCPDEILYDQEDEALVSEHNWHINAYGYAYAVINYRQKMMHRIFMGEPKHLVVDHLNGNKLDNRRANLRITSCAINSQNLNGAHRDSLTGVRGVTYNKKRKHWVATARIFKKHYYIGVFRTKEEAAFAASDFRLINMPGMRHRINTTK